MDREIYSFGHGSITSTVKQMEQNRWNRICMEFLFLDEISFYKTMRGTTIYKSWRFRNSRIVWKWNVWTEWSRISKCDSIESQLLCMGRVNMTLILCGVRRVTDYYFASDEASCLIPGVIIAAQPLAVWEVNLVQSQADCPGLPQNKQSFLSKCLWCSSAVSFLSLPNLVLRSRALGAAEVDAEVGFTDLFCLDLWFPDWDRLELAWLDVDGFRGHQSKHTYIHTLMSGNMSDPFQLRMKISIFSQFLWIM
jgi:hypothetical protein